MRLLCLYLMATNFALGQEVVFKGNINKGVDDVRFISGIESNGTTLLNINRSESNDNFYLINSSKEVIQVYDIVSTFEKEHHVIHLATQGKYFYAYTYHLSSYSPPNSTRQVFTNIQYLKFAQDGSLRPQFTNLTGINLYEKYLMTLSKNDTVFIVTYNDEKYTASVNVIPPSQDVIRKEFVFKDKNTFEKFYRGDYFPVKNLSENSFETFLHKNKVYIRNNELVFTSDDDEGPVTNIPGNAIASRNRNTVFITRLNLATNQPSVRELRLKYSGKVDHNSFLHGDDLYTIGSYKDGYSIAIYDLPSNELIGTFTEEDIVRNIDWSTLIISNNKTVTPDKLKLDFPKLLQRGEPVIGFHYTDKPAIFFGLNGLDNRTEDGKIKILNNLNESNAISSLGKVKVVSGYSSSLENAAHPGYQPQRWDKLQVGYNLLKLPMYFVPSCTRGNEKRIYCKLPVDRQNLTLSTSVRPVATYDELELLTEEGNEKYESKAIYSFETDESIFIAYLTMKDEHQDEYVIIEKYPRK